MNYDQIVDTHKGILPVPVQQNPTPASPEGVNYGHSTGPIPLQPYPNAKYDQQQYCNQITPSPRSQDINVPYQGPECAFSNPLPYDKDACFLVSNEGQGVIGLQCNDSGGSDNANFVRGNTFGWDYKNSQSKQFKKPKRIIQMPVQQSLQEQNPQVVYDKNTFYPQPDWNLQKDPSFETYMEPSRFTPNGLPTYTFPYKVINPMKPLTSGEYADKMEKREATNDPVINDYPMNVPYPDFNPKISVENFENEDIEGKNLSMVDKKEADIQSEEGFQNMMMCPHRMGCKYCQKCPFGPNCKCGRGCPYCANCPIVKKEVLDNFGNQAIEGFENQQSSNLNRFLALILSIILILLIITIINRYLKK
jgi:hypothetical protein